MSKYDKGIQLINDILEKKEIIDNDEGILSVAALINIMNKKFDEFWKSFYSKDTLLLIEKGYAYVPEASGLCKIIPFFQDDLYELYFNGRWSSHHFSIYQEKDCNCFYYLKNDWDSVIKRLQDKIPFFFYMMREYNDYGKYLNWNYEKKEPNLTSVSFNYSGFSGQINFHSNCCSDCFLTFTDIDSKYQKAHWSDNRLPLYDVLKNNASEIIKRIPVDVNKIGEEELFKKAYIESKSYDIPKKYIYQ